MFIFKAYVQAGGLISYGIDPPAMFRKLGFYAAKILNGAKPADLPVEQAVKFELAINLKTAKAIGVELSTAIQLRADEVIESIHRSGSGARRSPLGRPKALASLRNTRFGMLKMQAARSASVNCRSPGFVVIPT